MAVVEGLHLLVAGWPTSHVYLSPKVMALLGKRAHEKSQAAKFINKSGEAHKRGCLNRATRQPMGRSEYFVVRLKKV